MRSGESCRKAVQSRVFVSSLANCSVCRMLSPMKCSSAGGEPSQDWHIQIETGRQMRAKPSQYFNCVEMFCKQISQVESETLANLADSLGLLGMLDGFLDRTYHPCTTFRSQSPHILDSASKWKFLSEAQVRQRTLYVSSDLHIVSNAIFNAHWELLHVVMGASPT
mmetsp:Transcript_1772/g.2618  ORF Transcript_1772/g.2618 Transcript_1772/m.2618 type:complete len:166 (+) Transcript_1772:740-1237(+)